MNFDATGEKDGILKSEMPNDILKDFFYLASCTIILKIS